MNQINNLFTVSASTSSKLADRNTVSVVRDELNARRSIQTVGTLECTFKGLAAYLDKVIVAKFVSAGIVDGFRYIAADGQKTNDEELGETMNPSFMKVVVDGRKAWFSLDLINDELFDITNQIWNAKERNGSLELLGFNDESEDAAYRGVRFTVTEAGALAAMLFGTKDNRATGLFFKNFIILEIRSGHAAYLETPKAKKIAEDAQARRAAKEEKQALKLESGEYETFQPESVTVTMPVIPVEAKLAVDSKGRIRKAGKFVGKDKLLVG